MKTCMYRSGIGGLLMALFVTSGFSRAESPYERFQRQDQEALRRFAEPHRKRTEAQAVREVSPATAPSESPVSADPTVVAGQEGPLPDPEPANTPAVETVLPTLPTITAWLPPPAMTNSAAYAIPADPCAGLTLSAAITEDPEWPEAPSDLLATPLALNLKTLTKAVMSPWSVPPTRPCA